jgi:hypothetical protein
VHSAGLEPEGAREPNLAKAGFDDGPRAQRIISW